MDGVVFCLCLMDEIHMALGAFSLFLLGITICCELMWHLSSIWSKIFADIYDRSQHRDVTKDLSNVGV